ncbi:hypothetical protein [uncultured Amnibacterium sp.]|uniref:hypothetical protein n=1 Tax=uncultured Amnibacterium sp. TaxID=1631851 RepID=UPI0035C9DD63
MTSTKTITARPGSRAAQLATLTAVLVALAGASAIVWNASYSSFSATTTNGSNSWSAGTVSIADDDSGSAMFTATNLKPGSTGSRCIVVTSSGSLPGTVKLYGTSASTTQALSSSINLTVSLGTGGSFGGGCGAFVADPTNPTVYATGSLASFASSSTGFATGAGTWAPAGGTVARTYKFDYTVDPAAPSSTAGGTAAITFVWEEQNS